jgi:hypothetical protein
MPIFETITEEQAENIAYQTWFLLQRGWKRIHRLDSEEYARLKEKWSMDRFPTYLWVKGSFTQTVSLYYARGYEGVYPVETGLFLREEAFDAERYLSANEQVFEDL